ncbi:MAG: DNA methyltransferase [Rhodospirillales bacterium]|nr:DNA methyltransferase [Rhodospirillales bacterium]
MNRLYYGDCLTIMRDHMNLGSVDLIYLDPPFQSNRDYNAIYKDETGRPLPDQINAFCDMWVLNEERERALRAMPVLMREAGIEDATVEFWRLWMNALRGTQPALLAYLSYMVERLVLMKGILKPTGSIYLHCDPTASHYIKVMMDAIFGHDHFQNEIIWRRYDRPKGSQHKARRYGRSSDTILFYSNGGSHAFNADDIRIPLGKEDIEKRFPSVDDKGRFMSGPLLRSQSMGERPNLVFEFQGYTPGSSGWRMGRDKLQAIYDSGDFYFTSRGIPRRKFRPGEEPGEIVDNIWTDIVALGSQDQERLGYATQKPVALLERIIEASTNPGDTVFDPFCGCATTLEAAHKLGRKWIGIDIAIHAIKRVAKKRLQERLRLAEGEHFTIEGVPHNIEGARDLWSRDKYHFQKWAVEQVDGFVTTKRSADGGIDGRVYFGMPEDDAHKRRGLESMAVEVKGGKNVGINVVRELRGVLDTDQALMAGLIVLEPLGDRKERNFRKFIADAGDLDVLGMKYARMQILTVDDILEGKRFHTPGAVGRVDQGALPLT